MRVLSLRLYSQKRECASFFPKLRMYVVTWLLNCNLVAEAIRYLEEGHVQGKVVMPFEDNDKT